MADGGQTELSFILSLETGGMEDVVNSIEQKFANIEASVNNIVTALSNIQMPQIPVLSGPAAAMPHMPPPDEIIEGTEYITEYTARQLNLRAVLLENSAVLSEFLSQQKQLNDFTVKEQKAIVDLIERLSKIDPAFVRANILSEEFANKLEALRGKIPQLREEIKQNTEKQNKWSVSLGFLTSELGGASKIIDKFTGKMGIMAGGLLLAADLLKTIGDEMREFAKANYESVGSVTTLQMQVRALQGSLSATPADALKAAKAVAMTGVHLDQGSEKFQKYTSQVMMLAYAYGVNEQASANLLARFDAMGATVADSVGALQYAAKAISFAGISAEEASKLIDKLNKSAWEAYAMYGSAEAARQFTDGMATMAAAARRAKVPLDDVLEVTEKIMKGGPEMIMALGGAAFNTAPAEKMANVMERLPELMQRVNSFPPELRESVSKSLTGMTYTQLQSLGRIRKEIGTSKEAWADYQKKIAEQHKVDTEYREAMQTLTGVLKEALMPVLGALTQILQPLAQGFIFLMKPIVVLGRMVGKLLENDIGRWIVYTTGAIIALTVAWRVLNLTFAKSVIGLTIIGLAYAIEWLMNQDLPAWINVVIGAVGALGVALLVLGVRAKFLGGGPIAGLIGTFRNLFGVFNKAKIPGGGGGVVGKTFKTRMEAIRDGLMVFARNSAQILKGAGTFALAMGMLMIPVVIVAFVVKELGISAGELAIVAGVMIGAMLAMSVAAYIAGAVGATFMGLMPVLLAFGIGIAIIGAAFIPAAYAFGLFGDALMKFNDVDFGHIGSGFMKIAGGLLAFAGAAVLLLPAAIAMAAGAVALAVATALMAGAMLLFPTTDFGLMAAHMETFANAINSLPGGLGNKFAAIRDVLSDIDDMEDADLSVLVRLHSTLAKLSEIPTATLTAVSSSIREIGAAASSIGSVPDLTTILAQNIIDGAARFAQASSIIDDYTTDLSEYLSRIEGFNDAIGPALKFEEDLTRIVEPGAKDVRPVAGAATLESARVSSSEARQRMIKLMEEQNALLAKLDRDPDNAVLEEKLSAIVARLDELIMQARGGPGVGEASVWQ